MDRLVKEIVQEGLRAAQDKHEETAQFLSMIHRMADLIPRQPVVDSLCSSLVRIIIEETDFENCSIVLWDEGERNLCLKAAFGLEDLFEGQSPRPYNRSLQFFPGEGIAGSVYTSKDPAYVENTRMNALPPKGGAVIAPASLVCLPLLDYGVLSVSSTQPRTFPPQTRRNWDLVSRLVVHMLGGMGAGRRACMGESASDYRQIVEGPGFLQSEETVHITNSLREQAMDHAPQGICLLNRHGEVEHINESMIGLHGGHASELRGRSPAVLFQSPASFEELFQEAMDSGRAELTNVPMVNANGESYFADLNLVRLSEDKSTMGGFLFVIDDMTKRNAFADKMIKAEKLAALGIMAGGVAHDFNNLLMAILGNIQLLLPRIADEEVQRRLQNIEKAVHDGANTVRRLQKLTEVHKDQQPFPVLTEAAEAITDVVELTRPRWKNVMEKQGHAIEFRMELEPKCYPAINPSDLREVLTNLILNAIEAMPEGGEVTLRCYARDDSVLIEVADTGIGMSKEVSAKVFDPFYTTKGVGNSGLGLSVSWSLVTRSGGEIEARSKPGRGCAFVLRFPRVLPVRSRYAGPEPTSSGNPLRLLVVDDDEEILGILRDMLRLKGHTVTAVTDAEKALNLIAHEDYDLVLTDLGMPSVSGWEIAKRAKMKDPKLPVILVTGWGAQYEEEDLSRRGVDLVLSKPLSWDKLHGSITKLLGSNGVHAVAGHAMSS
jgi:PAS domain S-box-containing protein